MPALWGALEASSAARGDPEARIESLGRWILEDATLASRILRVAASALYGPANRPVATVPRALRTLGTDVARSTCLWLALVQDLSRGRRQERVQADLARSLHAGMQARALAQEIEPSLAEEIFLATFLRRAGTLAFWSFAEEEGVILETLLEPGVNDPLAEKTVLGFSLDQLTSALVEEGGLSPLLGEILRGQTGSPGEICLRHGWEVARLAERGWAAGAVHGLVAKGAGRHGKNPTEFGGRLRDVARGTREVAHAAGLIACTGVIGVPEIPVGQEGLLPGGGNFELEEGGGAVEEGGETTPSSHLLLETYQELADLALQGRVTPMFQAVLKTARERIGFGRIVFAALVPGTDLVQGKTAQGLAAPLRPEVFQFTIRRQMADSLSRSMEQGHAVVHYAEESKTAPVLPESLRAFVQGGFVFAPVHLGHRAVGAFYGDTWTIERPLTKGMTQSFLRLIQQLDLLLAKASAVRAATNGA